VARLLTELADDVKSAGQDEARAGLAPAPGDLRASSPGNPRPTSEVASVADRVPLIWSPGEVILDLYEVKPFDSERDYAEGGMGRVYRVHHRNWNLDIAVKSPLPDKLQHARDVGNFEREAETWVKLGLHPHTVTCYYVRRLGGIPRVFAELVTGGSLKDWIDSGELYEGGTEKALERVLDIAIQFAWGLHHAHEQGLVHQDVKPSNVMMTDGGVAKMTDFGLAKARAVAADPGPPPPGHTWLASWGGMTVAYCSPEQSNVDTLRRSGCPPEGWPKLTRRTDVWSWAVSVLEMFTGDVTWRSGAVAGGALEAYLEMGAGDDRLPTMPRGVADLLRQCLRRDPQSRPADMRAIATTLGQEYTHATGQGYPRQEPAAVKATADSLNLQAVSMLDLVSDEADRERRQAAAEAFWIEALKADPRHVESLYNLGLLSWRDGRITDTELLDRIRELGSTLSDEVIVPRRLAEVYRESGHCQSVVRELEKIPVDRLDDGLRVELQRARDHVPSSQRNPFSLNGHPVPVHCVALSADARHALSVSGKEPMRLWDVAKRRCLRTLVGHNHIVSCVAMSVDGRVALTGSWDKTSRLWDLADGRCLRTFEGHTGPVTSVALSADGRVALSGSWDNTLRLWDPARGGCLRTFEGHTNGVESVALSADGRYAVSLGADSTFHLWDLAKGCCLRVLNESGQVCMAISADARLVLSGGRDNAVRLWDIAQGRCLYTFKEHTDEVTSVVLSGDGHIALSGSKDKTLRLRDPSAGRCVSTIEGHTHKVTCVALSANGRLALSGSSDRSLRLWDVTHGRCLRIF
jgi:serine/threonine protein kinase